MSIVKNAPSYLKHSKKGFTVFINETIEHIKDPASIGIYLYLSSKPEDWEISETQLQRRFGKGRDFIRARLAELKKLGLLRSISIRDQEGKIERWETILYNEIQITENPLSGETSSLEDPPTTNKRIKQKKEIKKTSYSPPEEDVVADVKKTKKKVANELKVKLIDIYHEIFPDNPRHMTKVIAGDLDKVLTKFINKDYKLISKSGSEVTEENFRTLLLAMKERAPNWTMASYKTSGGRTVTNSLVNFLRFDNITRFMEGRMT